MSKKHRKREKRQHRPEHHDEPADHNEGEASMVYTVSIQPHPDDKDRHAEEQDYRKKQLTLAKWLNIISAAGGGIAFAALLALIYYASVTRSQWKTMQESNRINKISSELAYRPYIGEDGISVAYGEEDAIGTWQLKPMQTPKTTMMDFGAQIKNFGPVPGRNHVSEWRIFMGGDEMPSVKIPDTPSTLFPGQVVGLSARVGKKDFQSIISGKSLVVEVTTEYDGPSGHYKECTKSQYVPDNHGFFNLGACTH